MLRKAKIIFILLNLLCFASAFSQKKYFQQEVNFNITVSLNDSLNELNAFEEITYINNSPDTLKEIYFHLWPNAYSNNETALSKDLIDAKKTALYFAKPEELGTIDNLDFKIDDATVSWSYYKGNVDICVLKLDKPLLPSGKILIKTPFHVKIPEGKFSRLGHIGQSYQITQWFPKPAVYDLNGWNMMPYLNQGEFYSEFGSFDVSVTLPRNYVVGATGDLVNGETELEWLNVKAKQTLTKKELNPKDTSFPVSDRKLKTLCFHQENVHDFAWFADKRWNVLKGEVELPDSKRKVTTWTMFTNLDAIYWNKSISYVNDAIYYYSKWIGEYPYNHATAVEGALSAGGGMEYPNITIIGRANSDFALEQVIMHEVGHNWFYGILGSNERNHPWMDEGVNSFYESRYLQTKYPKNSILSAYAPKRKNIFGLGKFPHRLMYYYAYLFSALNHKEQPIEGKSDIYSSTNYGTIVYMKSAAFFDYLKSYLGDEDFDNAMKEYFNQWKFKHPQPKDLKNVFEQQTGKNLNWFFDTLINTTAKIDYKVVAIEKGRTTENEMGYCYKIKIKNKGDVASPFCLSGIKKGEVGVAKWYEGFKDKKTFTLHYIDVDKVKIDADYFIPEINRKNNTIRTKGLFRKVEPIKLQLLWAIDDPNKTQILFFPVVGWNYYDKWMPGISIYSNPVFPKAIDYLFVPMYGTKTKELVGSANIGATIFPKINFFQAIRIGVAASQYNYDFNKQFLNFCKIVPEINFEFKNRNARSHVKSNFRFRNLNINQEKLVYDKVGVEYVSKVKSSSRYLNDFLYQYSNSRIINPFDFSLNVEQTDKMVKASATLNYRITYYKKNKGLDIRLFAGKFILDEISNSSEIDYRFRLTGQDGRRDYKFDNYFLGRSETNGLAGQQFVENDGAFKTPTVLGQTWDWLGSMNLKASLPIKVPINIFADLGFFENQSVASKTSFVFDAGIQISIFRNICDIYLPLLCSENIKNAYGYSDLKFVEKIRFTFNLNQINPFKQIKNIE